MQNAAEHKNTRARGIWTPPPSYQRRIDMSLHEMIYRLIPGPPISANARTIPPLRVKFSVAKPHNLRQCVERRLENSEESG